MRKLKMKRILMLVVSLLICIGMIACGSSTEKKEEKKEDKNKTYSVGETIELKNQKFTVNGIRSAEKDKDGILKAEDGKEFLYVSCTIENTSDEEISVSSILLFKVVDKEGQECKEAFVTDTEGQLDGKVLVGKKLKGEYVAQVPKGATELELQYTTGAITGETVVVKLN